MARNKKTTTQPSIFTTNFNRVLAERNLTLKMAAHLLELPYSTVADYAHGAQPTDLEAIGRFCKKLGIDFSWLMLNESSAANIAHLPFEALFDEEADSSFEGYYKISAIKLKKKGKKSE